MAARKGVDRPTASAAGKPTPRRHHGMGKLFAPDLWPIVPPLLGLLAGLAVLATGRWFPGLLVVGGAVLLAAVERLVLPRRLAGLLIVRRRWFDVMLLTALGVGIIVVALLR